MADDILFMEGFELYNDANDIADSGWTVIDSDIYIASGLSSYSAQCLKLGNYYGQVQSKKFSSRKTVYVGFNMQLENFAPGVYWTGRVFSLQYNGIDQVYVYQRDGWDMPVGLALYGPNGYIRELNIPDLSNARWEFLVTVDETEGRILFRYNGTEFFDEIDLDTKNDSAEALINQILITGGSIETYIYIDDIYVSDSKFYDTASIGVMTPNGAGSNTDWTPSAGSNYDCVNDIPFGANTSNYTESNTPTYKDSFSMSPISDIATTSGYRPAAVRVALLGERMTDGVARSVSVLCISDTSQYSSNSEALPFGDKLYISAILQENPAQNGQWIWQTLNNAEFGYSLDSSL